MTRSLFAAVLAVVLTLSFTTTFSQDAMKKDAMKKDAMMKEAKPALKSVSCDPDCGFMVRSHDENEIISLVKEHAKKQHNKDVTDKDVMAMMKPAGMKSHMKDEKK
jgi:predicted small metal-binding protein